MKIENPRQEFAIRAENFATGFGPAAKDDAGMQELIRETVKDMQAKQASLDLMFAHFDENGPQGVTYTNGRGLFAVVLPDATHQGLFRAQYFDASGFVSHSIAQSDPEVVICEVCDDGLSQVAAMDTLMTMSQSRKWKRGMEVAAVVQAVQQGRMSWQEAELRYAEIDEKYDPDLYEAA